MELIEALQVLDLQRPLSRIELKKAHRDALFVWHPDRFDGNPGLQGRAKERTCLVNEAYSVIVTAMGGAEYLGAATPPLQRACTSPPPLKDTVYEKRQPQKAGPGTEVSTSSGAGSLWSAIKWCVVAFGCFCAFLILLGLQLNIEHGRPDAHHDGIAGLNEESREGTLARQAAEQQRLQDLGEAAERTRKHARAIASSIRLTVSDLRPSQPSSTLDETQPGDSLTLPPGDRADSPLPTPTPKLLPDAQLRHLPWEERPESGTIFANHFVAGGRGELTVKNGMPEDAFIKVIHSARVIASFYVRGGSQFKLSGIPDGTFGIIYSTGYGWDATSLKFERGRHATKFDQVLTYDARTETNSEGQTLYWDSLSLTLHKVPDGNAETTDITSEEFDRY